ncbi:protein CHROMATIN REMODELING 19-like isoform X3 [Panicum virgatum]|uniref:protein CHROMATIN REMODELING 19-like isoform X2 n=1 Tax=Panicum virgatum TaxID=38727 RepID=UPI0019D531DE|nr:protein CHROMATIN REMODELING 19-like isoform X2 [Panicum virgatum]XP_039819359.1 protein CHROMATIN REMODELING 19-like isoform X3 [Panicum virgatum]
MPRAFEEISDEEWSLHTFEPSRVLKRSNKPPSQPPPPIDSFRYNPKSSSAAGTSTATVVLSDDDFDLGADGRSRRAAKSQRGLKRPHHGAPSRAPPSTGSFRHNPKPSKAAAALGLSDSEDDDFDITNHDFDLPASPSRTSRLRGKGKNQRVLKRPQHRPHSQALPSIGSFRHNPKPSKAAAITGLSNSEDDDFDLTDHDLDLPVSLSRTSPWRRNAGRRLLTPAIDMSEDELDLPTSPLRTSGLRRKGKSQHVGKHPQHQPHWQAPSIGSFRHNPKPSKAAATTGLSDTDDDDFDLTDHDLDIAAPPSRTSRPRRAAGRRLLTAAIDISEEDEDLDLADDDFDYQDPRPFQQRPSGRRFVIGDDDDSDVPVAVDVEDDDEVDWSALENEDEEECNVGRNVHVEEREGDVVGMALRKCSRISADLRQELFGTSARNIESYAETDASTCRIVTQEDVSAACTSENSGFDPVLKPYQLVGVNFLLLLHRKSIGGAILADEMGLGKTVQAVTYLTLLRHLYNDPGPHLIVCPASVLENWERELKKWCPSFSIVMFHGAGRTAYSKELSSLGKAGCPAPFNVLLVGYTLFERRSAQQKDDRKALKRWRWSCVLMDEAHVLKDKGSFRWRNLMAVAQHARQRLMLTGTPLQNDLHELWSLLEFMMPDIFATGDVDLKKLLNAEDRGLISHIKSILGPFILRRLKSDVMQQLVPKIQHVKFVIMDTEQSKAYQNSIDEYRSACQARSTKSSVDITNNVVGLIPKRQISNYFTQFRKIANHPLLVRRFYSDKDVDRIARLLYPKGAFGFECSLEKAIQELKNYNDFDIHQLLISYGDASTKGALTDEHVFASAKCQALAELLPSLANNGHRVLIFSQWTTMLDILEWALEVIGVTYRRLDGGTPVTERQTIVDTFNNDHSIFACLLSTRAGGQGLNLIGADTVIIHDMDFNPQMDRQAEDRCHRIGQQKPVTVYRLVTKGSVDENIYEIARRKLVLDAAILQSGAELDNSTDVPEKTMGEILASLLLA